MDKIHRQIGDRLPFIETMEITGVGEDSKIGCLNIHLRGQADKSIQLVGWNCQGHPFLRFRNENFPWLQSRIFEWCTIKMKLKTTGILCHFTDRGRETPCPVIGN